MRRSHEAHQEVGDKSRPTPDRKNVILMKTVSYLASPYAAATQLVYVTTFGHQNVALPQHASAGVGLRHIDLLDCSKIDPSSLYISHSKVGVSLRYH